MKSSRTVKKNFPGKVKAKIFVILSTDLLVRASVAIKELHWAVTVCLMRENASQPFYFNFICKTVTDTGRSTSMAVPTTTNPTMLKITPKTGHRQGLELNAVSINAVRRGLNPTAPHRLHHLSRSLQELHFPTK
jgi:hypothetical protein